MKVSDTVSHEVVVEKILQVRVSPMFDAILDCMLDIEPRRTTPSLSSMYATSDGFFLGERTGDIGANLFLGDLKDLHLNIEGVASVAELTEEEGLYLLDLAPKYRL